MNKASIIIICAVVILVFVGFGYQFFKQNESDSPVQSSTPTSTPRKSDDSAKALLERVGQLILLPTDEQPTVATVTNLEALKGQEFFRKAKVGYKVIIYIQAKKAILYDPVENRLIEVAPFDTSVNSQN